MGTIPNPSGINLAAKDNIPFHPYYTAKDFFGLSIYLNVTPFLVWAADPNAQERQTLSYYVIGYQLLLTTLLYFLKRRIWARLSIIQQNQHKE